MPITITETNGDGSVSEKLYEKVVERLERFRKDCPIQEGWALTLNVMFPEKTRVLAEAIITDPEKRVVASGHSEKARDASEFTDATVEWTSTAAIGRALGAAGYGTGEIATADEILLTMKDQLERQPTPTTGVSDGNDRTTRPSPRKTIVTPKSRPGNGNGRTKNGNGTTPSPEILKVMEAMGMVPFDNPNITYTVEDGQLVIGGKVLPVGPKLYKAGFTWVGRNKTFVKPIH